MRHTYNIYIYNDSIYTFLCVYIYSMLTPYIIGADRKFWISLLGLSIFEQFEVHKVRHMGADLHPGGSIVFFHLGNLWEDVE